MPTSSSVPSLKGQIITWLLFVVLAVIITISFHPKPAFSEWKAGMPIGIQFATAGAFAALASIGALLVVQFARFRKMVRVPEALNKIDLSGAKPWIVGLCAGVGEELLFRAALQPIAGLWLGATIFAAAHVKTATLSSTSNTKRLVYILNVAVAGVALGLAFEHIGLLAAVLIHSTIDVVGLLVYRSVAMQKSALVAA